MLFVFERLTLWVLWHYDDKLKVVWKPFFFFFLNYVLLRCGLSSWYLIIPLKPRLLLKAISWLVNPTDQSVLKMAFEVIKKN